MIAKVIKVSANVNALKNPKLIASGGGQSQHYA